MTVRRVPRGPTGARRAAAAPPVRRRRGPLGTTLVVLLVLVVVGGIVADVLTDVWWYDSVGFRGVFVKELTTKAVIFLVAGLLTGGAVAASLVVAYRTRPLYIPVTPAQQVLEQYRQAIEPLRRLAVSAVPVVLGLLAGSGSMGAWRTFLLWANREPFGIEDPQFGLDVGFFVFTLPWLRFLVSFVTVVLVLAFVAARLHPLRLRRAPAARPRADDPRRLRPPRHPRRAPRADAGGLLLARPLLPVDPRAQLLTGITYTDDNAVLPDQGDPRRRRRHVRRLLPRRDLEPQLAPAGHRRGAARGHRRRRRRHLPGAHPALKVKPSREVARGPLHRTQHRATRTAFGLDRVKRIPNPAAAETEDKAVLRAAANDIPGVRIIDPNVVAPTFRQLEGQRDYYAFPDTLDVDRYTIDEKTRDAVVAVREINLGGLPDDQRNWLNDHTVYTHGYGFYAAYGNQSSPRATRSSSRAAAAAPSASTSRASTSASCRRTTPSSVRRPARQPREFDFPAGGEGEVAVNNTYAGSGGVADRLGAAPARLRHQVPRGRTSCSPTR